MTQLETFLVIENLGDSLDSVEALIKKHDDFEKSLPAQVAYSAGLCSLGTTSLRERKLSIKPLKQHILGDCVRLIPITLRFLGTFGVLDMTLNNLMTRLQPWRFGECGETLHSYCSQVHTDPKW